MKIFGYLLLIGGASWAALSWLAFVPSGPVLEAVARKLVSQRDTIIGLLVALVGAVMIATRENYQRRQAELDLRQSQAPKPAENIAAGS